jgi:hypothetical protein
MRLFAPLYGSDLTRAYWYVQGLPLTDYEAFAADAALDDWVALDQVCSFFDAMGLMLHRGIAQIGLLDELLTTSVFETCNKCASFVEGNRVETRTPQNYQWFEYLVRTLDRHMTERRIDHPALIA